MQKISDTGGFKPHPADTDESEGDYYRGLIPEYAWDLKKELAGFAKDLAGMDLDEIFGVLVMTSRETRLARVKVELVEKRLKFLESVKNASKIALGADQNGT